MKEKRDLLLEPDAPTRPALLSQIQDALKNRQHVQISGRSDFTRKLLDELISFERGKAVIPAKHEEDYTIQVIQNVAFPTSDKMTIENVMIQVLQEFGWPPTGNLGFVQFYFGKLLKELLHDRVVPVFLFENPEVLRQKAFQLLRMLSEHTIDRKPVGIPSIVCITERNRESDTPLSGWAFKVELVGDLTKGEVLGLIEESCPGTSDKFDGMVINDLIHCSDQTRLKVIAKELVTYMRRLGLERVSYDLMNQWRNEKQTPRKHAKANA